MEESFDSDLLWREFTLVALGLAALVYVVGGLASQVAGAWRLPDGTTWALRQFGPWVRGIGAVPNGYQTLSGRVWFGRLHLMRRDFGAGHLRTLGFTEEQAQAVEGHVTGHFALRQRGAHILDGTFVGRSFSFSSPAGRPSSRLAAAVPRRLERLGG